MSSLSIPPCRIFRAWLLNSYFKNFHRSLRGSYRDRTNPLQEEIQAKSPVLDSQDGDNKETFARNKNEIRSKQKIVASQGVKDSFLMSSEIVKDFRRKKIENFVKQSQENAFNNLKLGEPKQEWYSSEPDSLTLEFVKKTEDEVFEILKESVIYNEHGLVVLNKPYGLVCQYTPDYFHHIQKFIPRLARFVDSTARTPDLHVVHRLDIGTTGVYMLAKNLETKRILKRLFRERKIQKTYWAITKGVPSPPKGTVDVPLAEGEIEGAPRVVIPKVKGEWSEEEKLLEWRNAITEYQVISATENFALLELKPKTGLKHQLRVHLGFALSCPVLGDHKYSNRSKLGSQKLPENILSKFELKEGKEQCLPIFLHSKSVAVPDLADGRSIFVEAPLPKRFKLALKKLKLNILSYSPIDTTGTEIQR